jgi:cytochrome c biogenesis protein CcmG/thiol:disulfide interchange protein DsbE
MDQGTPMTQLQPDVKTPAASPQAANRPQWGKLIVWTGLFALLSLLALGLLKSQKGTIGLGSPLPEFSLQTFDGQTINSADLQGKVVVINFWASWCPPCKEEAPFLESAWRSYAQRDDVIFLGLAYADTPADSQAYLKEFDITYPNAPDLGTRIYTRFRATGVPETYIFDRSGKLAYKILLPFSSEAQLRQAIDPLLTP